MSTSTSVAGRDGIAGGVTPSPRKGRHTRSQAVTSTSNSADGGRPSLSLMPPTSMGLPPGIDPITLDPDETFVRFGVREVQSIESSLRASHESLTARLRMLVSERYRDMLGTANTLIDMSASSTHLVQRLEHVLDGIQRAGAGLTEGPGQGLTGLLRSTDEGREGLMQRQEEGRTALFAIAATTKLIAEAPDEVWKAIDAAMQAGDASLVAASKKQALQGRELSDFQAATILRAAWIFTLAEACWTWLTKTDMEGKDTESPMLQNVDAQQLFPYIARQRTSLSSMRAYIIHACVTGLSGWMEGPATATASRWEDLSTSYLATVTSLISLTLLEGSSLQVVRDTLLRKRKETLEVRLRSSLIGTTASHGDLLGYIVRFLSDTLLQTLKAFALPSASSKGYTRPHMAVLYGQLRRPDRDSGSSERPNEGSPDKHDFPPSALDALHTMPSAAILTQHLPVYIRAYAPVLAADDDLAELQGDTVQELQAWTTQIEEELLADALPPITDKLTTIATIGEAQSSVWAILDRCCAQATRVCGDDGRQCATMVERKLHSLGAQIDTLLMARLTNICQAYGDELSTAVTKGTQEALDQLRTMGTEADDVDPALFLFETSVVSEALTLDTLERRLRLRTKHVQSILNIAEERARDFANETRAYSSCISRAEARRAARKLKANQAGRAQTESSDHRRENGEEVLAKFDSSLQRAKASISTALSEMKDALANDSNASAANLFLARLVSALRHSSVFITMRAEPTRRESDEVFVQDLRDLQYSLLSAWVEQAVEEALDVLQARRMKPAVDLSIGNAQSDAPSSLPHAASSSLLGALAVLSRRAHLVGAGYGSEAVWLRSRLTGSFCLQWLETAVPNTSQDVFDVAVLQAILGIADAEQNKTNGTAKKIDDIRSVLAARLREAKSKALSQAGISTMNWSQHLTAHLPSALARIRLIVAGVVIDEAFFAAAVGGGLNRAKDTGKGRSLASPASVPPLPMLQLARPRQHVPRIRPDSNSVITTQ